MYVLPCWDSTTAGQVQEQQMQSSKHQPVADLMLQTAAVAAPAAGDVVGEA